MFIISSRKAEQKKVINISHAHTPSQMLIQLSEVIKKLNEKKTTSRYEMHVYVCMHKRYGIQQQSRRVCAASAINPLTLVLVSVLCFQMSVDSFFHFRVGVTILEISHAPNSSDGNATIATTVAAIAPAHENILVTKLGRDLCVLIALSHPHAK